MLPNYKNIKLDDYNFPVPFQEVIFRNYSLVETKYIAKVLNTSIKNINIEAKRLGLKKSDVNLDFCNRSYITIIRSNWYLLNYDQLLILLNWTKEKLEFILKEDDFLYVKLGYDKPYTDFIYYKELSEKEKEETKKIAKTVKKYYDNNFRYFNFFKEEKTTIDSVKKETNNTYIIHGYMCPCGDIFMEDSKVYMPDELLKKYQDMGINGIFVHGMLSALSKYKFMESLSKDYKKRRENLKILIARAKQYGIGIYLYLNEPRAIHLSNIKDEYKHLIGHVSNEGFASLCLENKEVQDYLYDSIKDLFDDCIDLKGIISISMSENLTHCNSVKETNCKTCKNISSEYSASLVMNIINKALKDSKSVATLIAYLWGWDEFMGWTNEMVKNGIDQLDKDISIMVVSEHNLPIIKGGIKSKVDDYSISNVGPAKFSKNVLEYAKKTGHKTFSKIQAGNSWELSSIPYVPAYNLIYKHVSNLNKIGVRNFMYSWTLGGYPSPNFYMINYTSSGQTLDEWYLKYYKENANEVKEAINVFSKAFTHYPFEIDTLYFSPKTLGPANLYSLEKQEKTSSMVCYTFDDLDTYLHHFGYDIYIKEMKKAVSGFKKSLNILKKIENKNDRTIELIRYINVAEIHYESDLNQTMFNKEKNDIINNRKDLLRIVKIERKNTIKLIELMKEDSKIGFEASNHYFYSVNNLIEKIINLDLIKNKLLGDSYEE